MFLPYCKDRNFKPLKTGGKIIIPYILICMFLRARGKTNVCGPNGGRSSLYLICSLSWWMWCWSSMSLPHVWALTHLKTKRRLLYEYLKASSCLHGIIHRNNRLTISYFSHIIFLKSSWLSFCSFVCLVLRRIFYLTQHIEDEKKEIREGRMRIKT
jgi:hypothetical protein